MARQGAMTADAGRAATGLLLLIGVALGSCGPAPHEAAQNDVPAHASARAPVSHPARVPTPTPAVSPRAASLVIDLAPGSRVALLPIEESRDRATACIVELRSDRAEAQRLTVIGEGETEAISCDGLIAAGRVSAPAGRQRIALLYRAHSPNADVVQPVILTREGPAGRWSTDDGLAQRISEKAELRSIPAIRQWIAQSHR